MSEGGDRGGTAVKLARVDVRRTALTGMLFALAMALSFFEAGIGGMMALPPGIKLGLSNIVVLFALLAIGKRSAWFLAVLKAFFALLTRGAVAGLLSLSGGLCSILLMQLLIALPRLSLGYRVLGAMGGCAHNIGQLAAAALLIRTPYLFYYLPLLLISGMLAGFLTGTAYFVLEPYLRRWRAGPSE